jgi:hypothetical protein
MSSVSALNKIRASLSHPSQLIHNDHNILHLMIKVEAKVPVTVAEWSNACTVFARSKAEIVGSNPTQGMGVWCLCVYVRFSVFVYRQRLCDELITRPRSHTGCLRSSKLK